jgi:hypothetical protein
MTKAEQVMQKIAKHFTEQHHPAKVKEIYKALKREHPEYSAGKKARIANATYDKMAGAKDLVSSFIEHHARQIAKYPRTHPEYLDKINELTNTMKNILISHPNEYKSRLEEFYENMRKYTRT